MGLKNWSTVIPASKTVGEIQSMLIAHGASSVSVNSVNREPIELLFSLDTEDGPRSYRLPANADGVLRALQEQRRRGEVRGRTDRPQAQRVAWRIVRDWVAAQLAVVEAGAAEADQVFLAWAQLRSGHSLYEDVRASQFFLALPEPVEGRA